MTGTPGGDLDDPNEPVSDDGYCQDLVGEALRVGRSCNRRCRFFAVEAGSTTRRARVVLQALQPSSNDGVILRPIEPSVNGGHEGS